MKFLKIIQPTLEGKTEKQKNPFIYGSLAWAAWIIAKLEKWNGYTTQSPPGYITMKNGMDIFYLKYDTFLLTCQAMGDVYMLRKNYSTLSDFTSTSRKFYSILNKFYSMMGEFYSIGI